MNGNKKDEVSERIKTLLRDRTDFAIYKKPLGKEIILIYGKSKKIEKGEDIFSKKDGKNGFLIVPFRESEHYPALVIHTGNEGFVSYPIPKYECCPDLKQRKKETGGKENYNILFRKFKRELKNGIFQKIVLSRVMEIEKTEEFSPEDIFLRACNRYEDSYVYLFHTRQSGIWTGCTPETILSNDTGKCTTVAIAGTQKLKEDGSFPLSWTEKQKKEQNLVSDYIVDRLKENGISTSRGPVYPVKAGGLCHLRNDIFFELPENVSVREVLSSLHPTPAVCGLPEEEAYTYISSSECHERKYYSGYIGGIEANENCNLYVNLRCMNILENRIALYAGGGLLPESDEKEEFEETENKLQTMLSLF